MASSEESISLSLRRQNYISVLGKLYALEKISKDVYVGELMHVAKAEGYNISGIVLKEELLDDRK